MTEKKRGRGRPPKNGERAMTDAERQKRYRERLRQKQVSKPGQGPRFAPFAQDEAALLNERARINEAAAATTDPIRSLVLETRYAATDALIWMSELANAIFAGKEHLRGKSFQTYRRLFWSEQSLRELEAALDERDAAAPVPVGGQSDSEEYRTAVRNIIGEGDVVASLHDMRLQLLLAHELAKTTIARLEDVKGAVRSGKMDRETRKAVLAEIQELDGLAWTSLRSLVPDTKNPPAWTRGQRDWT